MEFRPTTCRSGRIYRTRPCPTQGRTPTLTRDEGKSELMRAQRGGVRLSAGPSTPAPELRPDGRRPRRAWKIAAVTALAIAMFAAGAVGLFRGRNGSKDSPPGAPVPTGGLGAGNPVILSGTLRSAI